ncbi:unnamed protein product [Cuscuta europaea]|uniref:Uncharacterized protein n=1 Tax=Cuscuta europaea TaxID=41803 RepID=A0A9P0YYC0_CUSEU|nr:unnamed protein product [Cuscuta europaea]
MGQARDDREVMGFAVNVDGRHKAGSGKQDKSGITCGHCNIPGHEISRCFELVGYPEWWGDRPRFTSKNGGRGGRDSAARGGTSAGRGCGGARAHAAAVEGASLCVRHDSGEEKAGQLDKGDEYDRLMPGFTQDQWKAFLSAFGPTLEEADWSG